MQSIPSSLYPNLLYPLLCKAADSGQKCGESFAGDLFMSCDTICHSGWTKEERFIQNLKFEVEFIKKRGSLSEGEYDEDTRRFELKMIDRMRVPYPDSRISRQCDSIKDFASAAACSPILVTLGASSLLVNAALQSKAAPVIGLTRKRRIKIFADEFSILTLNASLFQRRILNAWSGFMTPLKWRCVGIGRFLRDLKVPVICLQGAYHSQLVKKQIMSRLQRIGYDTVLAVKPGLMTASRYPICDVKYRCLKLNDDSFELGVLLTTIKVDKKKYVIIANTRLIGRHEDLVRKGSREEARTAQLKKVRIFLRNYSHQVSYPVYDRLIVGDFGVSSMTSCSDFPLTRTVSNPEHSHVEEILLNKSKGLAYRDVTEHVPGTQLEPFSVTFRQYLSLIPIEAYQFLRKNPVVLRNTSKGKGGGTYSLPTPYLFQIRNFFFGKLQSQKESEIIAKKYFWDRITKNRVSLALQNATATVKDNLFRYPDRTDYVCHAVRKSNLFSETPRSINLFAINSEYGILCDKLAVAVNFQLK